jgi:co-chaperonin GroES (HSP10)
MRTVTKILEGRVMIKALESTRTTASGLEFKDDGESLPIAEVVMVAEGIDQVSVGDKIHYTIGRESGKCRHNGDEHFIIPIGNAIAIVEDE